MPGLADLLRAGRVAGALFRLVGRHRLASVVAFVLALGWFLYGIGPAGAATVVAPGPANGPGPIGTGLTVVAAFGTAAFIIGTATRIIVGTPGTHRDGNRDREPGSLPGGKHAL